MEYDYIVITPNAYEEMHRQLIGMGIDAEKIKIVPLLEMKNKVLGYDCYSQHGEELILATIFKAIGIDKPSYIDLGANHPTFGSNTAFFYEQGCRGINIEANPLLMDLFKMARPGDINLNVGCGTEEGTLLFYIFNDTSGRNTFSPRWVDFYESRKLDKVTKTIELPVTKLKKITDKYCADGFPDLLDCDIEGMDYDVLADYDFAADGPKVILAEVPPLESDKFDKMLKNKGYFRYCRITGNAIYVRNEYSEKVQGIKI